MTFLCRPTGAAMRRIKHANMSAYMTYYITYINQIMRKTKNVKPLTIYAMLNSEIFRINNWQTQLPQPAGTVVP